MLGYCGWKKDVMINLIKNNLTERFDHKFLTG